MVELFRLPPSPFQKEKDVIGDGFLAAPNYGSRSRSVAGAGEQYAPVGLRNRYGVKLTPAERRMIGATGPEIPRRELAERFGISEHYVTRLRVYHRRERKPRQGEQAEKLQREVERAAAKEWPKVDEGS